MDGSSKPWEADGVSPRGSGVIFSCVNVNESFRSFAWDVNMAG